MLDDIKNDASQRMQKCIQSFPGATSRSCAPGARIPA